MIYLISHFDAIWMLEYAESSKNCTALKVNFCMLNLIKFENWKVYFVDTKS